MLLSGAAAAGSADTPTDTAASICGYGGRNTQAVCHNQAESAGSHRIRGPATRLLATVSPQGQPPILY